MFFNFTIGSEFFLTFFVFCLEMSIIIATFAYAIRERDCRTELFTN